MPGPPLNSVSASSSWPRMMSSPPDPAKVSTPGPPVPVVVPVAEGERVVARPAVDDVVLLLALDVVVPEAAVDLVRIRAAAQEDVVPLVAPELDRTEEVEAGAALAATVEVVVAAEHVGLEVEDPRRESDVDVAVIVQRNAVLPRRHDVGALRRVDDDRVGEVAERGVDLDLGDVELGRRSRAEDPAAVVEDQRLGRPGVPADRDQVGVRRGRAAASSCRLAEVELGADDDERRRLARVDRRGQRSRAAVVRAGPRRGGG